MGRGLGTLQQEILDYLEEPGWAWIQDMAEALWVRKDTSQPRPRKFLTSVSRAVRGLAIRSRLAVEDARRAYSAKWQHRLVCWLPGRPPRRMKSNPSMADWGKADFDTRRIVTAAQGQAAVIKAIEKAKTDQIGVEICFGDTVRTIGRPPDSEAIPYRYITWQASKLIRGEPQATAVYNTIRRALFKLEERGEVELFGRRIKGKLRVGWVKPIGSLVMENAHKATDNSSV